MTSFLLKLPKRWYYKPLKTKIELANGSRIEAFPNNPDTIRGPTLNGIYCDEFNFVANDEDLYDAILFTLGTTNGEFICSSTPWSHDHMFYKICKDRDFIDFKRLHVTWKKALEPKGPLKKNILRKIKRQLAADPWRWQREMEAEWGEDESCWLPQTLIGQCQDSMLEIQVIDKRHSFWVVN
jgi:phage FluMu gp28-like protein